MSNSRAEPLKFQDTDLQSAYEELAHFTDELDDEDKNRPQKRVRLSVFHNGISSIDVRSELIKALHRTLNAQDVAISPSLDGISRIVE